jgi:arabinofuranosyltransferase
VVVLPPMWDFASAGLELGLAFAWLGACWWATARRLGQPELRIDRPWWVPVLIGLGPLIRPDMVVFSVAFAVALTVTSLPGWRSELRALGLALALPFAYQVFRMGYYGLLVPNTALAKEAGRSLWGRGWTYLDIYLGSTLLIALLLLLAGLWLTLWPRGAAGRRHAVVALAPVVAGLVHSVYMVRVGGDFMYARLFLPATFALACPVAALPLPRDRRLLWGPIGILTVLLAYVGAFKRWDPTHITDNPDTPNVDGDLSIDGVANERLVYGLLAGNRNPVTYDDYQAYVDGPLAPLEPLPKPDTVVDLGGSGREATAKADRPVVVAGSIGLLGYRFRGVTLVDQLSLADAVGAHLVAGPPSRPGHEKIMSWDWVLGHYAKPSFAEAPAAANARAALRCGDLGELVDATEAPLTPGRFLRNLVGAPARTQLRIPADPVVADADLCRS